MATYGRWNRTITDAAGNIRNATVTVYKESDGLLATIYSDRAGTTPKSNPFTLSNSDYGLAFFHALGGAYKIVATDGSWSQTWRYEPVGTAAEVDVNSYMEAGYTFAPESGTTAPPSTGSIRANDADASLATHLYISAEALSTTVVTDWILGLAPGAKSVKNSILLSSSNNEEASWEVTAVTDNTTYLDITVDAASYVGPSPFTISNAGYITVSREMSGANGMSPGLTLTYSSTTTASDPGAGKFRLNNAAHASATAGYFDNVEALAGASITAELDSWDDSTSTVKGTLRIVSKADASIFRLYNITGSVVDSTGYRTVTLTYVNGNGSLADGDGCSILFTRTGDLGTTGATGATGPTGSTGATGPQSGIKWTFNSSTSNADPGSGKLAFNNATLASATALYISETDADSNGLAALLATWDDASATIKGTLTIEKENTPTSFAVFSITGTLTDNGTWDTFTLAHVASGGSFANNDTLRLRFSRSGDNGTDGVTGTLPVANGGTGLATITANNVLLGNGTSAMQVVAPGTSGNVLTSDGTTWASTALPASGGLTLLGTLTTTSGTTQSLTGIASGYNQFYIELDGVSANSTDILQMKLGSGSTSYGAAASLTGSIAASVVSSGFIVVGNVSSTIAAAKGAQANVMKDGVVTSLVNVATPTGTAAVATAVQFLWSGGAAFDAGAIRIYGVK